jgi:hypothetical protein
LISNQAWQGAIVNSIASVDDKKAASLGSGGFGALTSGSALPGSAGLNSLQTLKYEYFQPKPIAAGLNAGCLLF